MLGTIDLDKLDQKTKPEKKKGSKKAKEEATVITTPETPATPPVQEVLPTAELVIEEKAIKETPAPETPAVPVIPEIPAEPEVPSVEVRKTEYGKLDGPKVIGKLDLDSIKSKPVDYSDIIKAGKENVSANGFIRPIVLLQNLAQHKRRRLHAQTGQ